jgi:drug/metabolite transporter (DMT)-like permease
MFYIIASIICSVLLGLIFKFFPRYSINTLQAVVFNYATCVLVAWLSIGKFPINAETIQLNGFEACMIVGIFYITGFVAIGLSVQRLGIATTSVLQKMSMIAPILVAIFFFHESASSLKIVGILAAIFSIFLIIHQSNQQNRVALPQNRVALPLIGWATLLLSMLADLGIFWINRIAPDASNDPRLIATLFGTAGLLGFITVLVLVIQGKTKIELKNVLAGVVLGVPNYGSIYFLMSGLQTGMGGSVVFPLTNVGVILLSSALAFLVFKEHLSLKNKLGILLAMLAILLISFA